MMRGWWILGALALLLAASTEAGGTFSLGSPQPDVGGGVAVDAAGNLFVAGGFGGTLDFDPGRKTRLLPGFGQADIFVIRYDAQGNAK